MIEKSYLYNMVLGCICIDVNQPAFCTSIVYKY
jgi:hypothetical protein